MPILTTTKARNAQERCKQFMRSKRAFRGGFHFCKLCERITEKVEHNGREVCCFCGETCVAWHPPLSDLFETRAK